MKDWIITKAHNEIKFLFNGLDIDYKIDMDLRGKMMFAIEMEGYKIGDIISKLEYGEKLLFSLNSGWNSDWDEKLCKFSPLYKSEESLGSIYWKHNTYGRCIRIDSDMGSIQNWSRKITKELENH